MSTLHHELDWRLLPLDGRALIEASAGTGKTYNIALLHLRLVLQGELSVRQILVCTFTEAAASELKERLRARLMEAERVLSAMLGGATVKTDDALHVWLTECAQTGSAERLLQRARTALADLDLAPISTIHGYCRRLLSDYPFDSGSPFRSGEIADQSALINECVEDWWRQRFQRSSISRLESMWILPLGPRVLARRVEELWRVRSADVIQPGVDELEQCVEDLHSEQRIEQLSALIRQPELFARKTSALLTTFSRLLQAVSEGGWNNDLWKRLAEIDEEFVRKHSSKKLPTALRQQPFVDWLLKCLPLLNNRDLIAINGTAMRALAFVEHALPKRLAERELLSFDSMIERVHEGLHGESGAVLADRVYAAMPAALIDEFQDTDLQQWAIFDRIYRQSPGGDQRGALILIGDPKQSIYAFRGADVHAYLAARQALTVRRSISTNYRSSGALIAATNGLYAAAGVAAFNASEIAYQQVSAARADALPQITHAGAAIAQPLRIRRLPDVGNTLKARERQALSSCANDVADLLGGDYRLDEEPLKPGDIAVLVNTNLQLTQIREMLLSRGIPVVGSGRSDVFKSAWAADIQVLLHALLHPGRERALRAALATPLLGWRAVDLLDLEHDPVLWESQLERFAQCSVAWQERGILALMQPLIAEIAPRLLAEADGERALTDLRHLAELLQVAAEQCYGPEALFAWLVNARAGSSGAGEEAQMEHQLRIESDAARVQLSTLHGSKGLEYNCVFLPTCWRARGKFAPQFARFHDANHHLRVDLGGDNFEAHLALHLSEDLAERMRRLYVGLTRARHYCQFYVYDDLGHESPETWKLSELGVLLGAALASTHVEPEQRWEQLQARIPELGVSTSVEPPATFAAAAPATPNLRVRGELPPARPYRGLYSFTALTRGAAQPVENEILPGAEDEAAMGLLPSTAAASEPVADTQMALRLPDPRLEALAHWRGPTFGDAIHQIFEQRVIGEPMLAQLALVESQLRAQGIIANDSGNANEIIDGIRAVAEMIQRAINTPLDRRLSLSKLEPHQLRAEMEFCFVLDDASLRAINALLARHQPTLQLPSRGTEQLRGLMTGFIDLVFEWQGRFHLLDYKSNDLGLYPEDYQAASLDHAMSSHHYPLQALIYAVALHRYLRQRITNYRPNRHLGSSWYVFVRGMGIAPNAGIWQQPIDPQLISELDRLFAGETQA